MKKNSAILLFIISLTIFIPIAQGQNDKMTTERSLQSNTYHYENGISKIVMYNDYINYWNGTEFKEITNTFTPSDDILYDYMIKEGIYEAYFKSNPSTAETVKFWYNSSKKNDSPQKTGFVTFQPMSLNYRNDLSQLQQINMIQDVSGVPQENVFVYPEAFGSGLNLSYSYLPSRLKEELMIENNNTLPLPEQYILDGKNATLDLDFVLGFSDSVECYIDGEAWNRRTKTSGLQVDFKYADETIFYLSTPIAFETSHIEQVRTTFFNETSGQNETASYDELVREQLRLDYELKRSGRNYYITIRTPYDWLQENLEYPVTIDPSIEILRPNTDVETGWFWSSGDGTGTDHYYVNANDTSRTDWTTNGTQPYLDIADAPINIIYTSGRNYEQGNFDFDNSSRNPSIYSITLVRVNLFCRQEAGGNDKVEIYVDIDANGTWQLAGDVTPNPHATDFNEESIDITALDTWTWLKVNTTKMYLKKINVGGGNDVFADRSSLSITWLADTPHYEDVDEATADNDTTYIRTLIGGFVGVPQPEDDVYELPNTTISENATINYVRVYENGRQEQIVANQGYLRTILKTYATKYYGLTVNPPVTYQLNYTEYTVNPNTGSSWNTTELDALQVGVRGRSGYFWNNFLQLWIYRPVRCTQVYVEIQYTEAINFTFWLIRIFLFFGLSTFVFCFAILCKKKR